MTGFSADRSNSTTTWESNKNNSTFGVFSCCITILYDLLTRLVALFNIVLSV